MHAHLYLVSYIGGDEGEAGEGREEEQGERRHGGGAAGEEGVGEGEEEAHEGALREACIPNSKRTLLLQHCKNTYASSHCMPEQRDCQLFHSMFI